MAMCSLWPCVPYGQWRLLVTASPLVVAHPGGLRRCCWQRHGRTAGRHSLSPGREVRGTSTARAAAARNGAVAARPGIARPHRDHRAARKTTTPPARRTFAGAFLSFIAIALGVQTGLLLG